MAEYVYGCPRIDCMYRQSLDGSCEYYLIEKVTRTFLHKDEPGVDINNPCREYKPGKIHRKFAMRVKF